MVELRFHRTDKEVELPRYIRENDAAFDLRSAEDVVLKPGEKKIIKTGLRMAIPSEHVGLIWDRSGLAAKHSLHCLAGVIDCTYRGEVGVVMKNLGSEAFSVEKNMRIAQMLIQPVITPKITEVDDLDEDTVRGANGFGSSGLK